MKEDTMNALNPEFEEMLAVGIFIRNGDDSFSISDMFRNLLSALWQANPNWSERQAVSNAIDLWVQGGKT
jgi:hypothetical protein